MSYRLAEGTPSCQADRGGCAFAVFERSGGEEGIVSGNGRPTACTAEVVATGRVFFPANGNTWQVFACEFHRRFITDPDCRALLDRDRAELAHRIAQHARALAGKSWDPPRPLTGQRATQRASRRP